MFSDNPALQHLSDSDKASLWELTLWISEHADQTVGWTQLMRGTHMSQWELNALLAKINTNPMAYMKSVKEYLTTNSIATHRHRGLSTGLPNMSEFVVSMTIITMLLVFVFMAIDKG